MWDDQSQVRSGFKDIQGGLGGFSALGRKFSPKVPVQGCIRYTMLYPPVITQQVAKRTLRGYDSHELPLALSSGGWRWT